MSTRPTPEHLLAAYVESTGIRVGMSRQRREWLTLICAMPHRFTAEDVLRVLAGIKGHIARRTSGYTGASLLFGNAMNPDKFEERALLCREAQVRRDATAKRAAAKEAAPVEVALPHDPNLQANISALKRRLLGGGGVEGAGGEHRTSNIEHPTSKEEQP